MKRSIILAPLFGLAMTAAIFAQMAVPTDPVVFPSGSDTAVVNYRIEGRDVHGFTFVGSAGDPIAISLKAGTPSANFNLLANGDPAAVYNSSIEGTEYSGTLPVDGEYEIRIYLMGQAGTSGGADVELTITHAGGTTAVTAPTALLRNRQATSPMA